MTSRWHILYVTYYSVYNLNNTANLELSEMNEFLEHNNGVIERHCKIVAGLEGMPLENHFELK